MISSLELFPLCGNFRGTVGRWLCAQRALIVNDSSFPLSLRKETRVNMALCFGGVLFVCFCLFLPFSCNQKDQLLYKVDYVLETRIQSRIPGTSFPFFELMQKPFPSSPVYPEGTNKVAEAHSEPGPTSLCKFVHEVKKM